MKALDNPVHLRNKQCLDPENIVCLIDRIQKIGKVVKFSRIFQFVFFFDFLKKHGNVNRHLIQGFHGNSPFQIIDKKILNIAENTFIFFFQNHFLQKFPINHDILALSILNMFLIHTASVTVHQQIFLELHRLPIAVRQFSVIPKYRTDTDKSQNIKAALDLILNVLEILPHLTGIFTVFQ